MTSCAPGTSTGRIPLGRRARAAARAPLSFAWRRFAETVGTPAAADALKFYYTVHAVLLCRPAGTARWPDDDMVARAARCASAPSELARMWDELRDETESEAPPSHARPTLTPTDKVRRSTDKQGRVLPRLRRASRGRPGMCGKA